MKFSILYTYLFNKSISSPGFLSSVLELNYPKNDNYYFYQCVVNIDSIKCYKIKDKYSYKYIDNSVLVPVNKLLPEIFHKQYLYFTLVPKKLVIYKKDD